MQKFKQIAHDSLPPYFWRFYSKFNRKTGFFGNYHTWDEARRASVGYDADVILNKVKNALLKVKNGEAIYERDSFLFDKVQYSWPLLAGLLWVASREGNRLNIIDFGGSLGSSYFQQKYFFLHLNEFQWNIVEQPKFVEIGKLEFEDKHLRFYYNINECIEEKHPVAILLSSVVQYLERPYDLLSDIIAKDFKYILFDRTPFLYKGDDRITIQKVPKEIYKASYPSWFFNQAKFLTFFSSKYELIADFESSDQANLPSVFKGYIFKQK
ncbi:MAG TPA: methyltransferase, TIGR04325 family [Nitrospirota bacterium]|nr:methyltransferase, TIGR04325 family [Nitrospirota bacterium]HUL01208.1 methyltransferase, TIGR04325 family [Nitrospirota bacterium]